MNNTFSKKVEIDTTNCDFEGKVSVYELMRLYASITDRHIETIGYGWNDLKEYSNAFLVVSKMKVIINSNILNGDKLSIKTWMGEPSGVRNMRYYEVKREGSVVCTGVAEACFLDYETRRPRKNNTIKQPDIEYSYKKIVDSPFSNIKCDIEESDFVYKKVIRASDIDVNKHTNNLKYHIMTLDAFSLDELKDIDICEYEIYFVNECKESDELNIYKRKCDGYYYIEGKTEEKTIYKVVMKYNNK